MKQDLYNSDWINIDGNSIHRTAIVHPNVKLGTGNTIGAYCVIGGNGEIRGVKQDEFRGTVHIGNNNVISEHVTIQRPHDEKSTIIGNDNLIMSHSHIGHHAYIGNGCEICTSSVIGGYVTIYDKAKIKLHCVIRNRLIIGSEAVVGMGSVVTKNVPHFAIVYGNPAATKNKEEKEGVESKNIFAVNWNLILPASAFCWWLWGFYFEKEFYSFIGFIFFCVWIILRTKR